jgi:hypothetical protein
MTKRTLRWLVLCLGLAGPGLALSACAVETIPYPTLSTVTKIKDKVMSREEQDEAIRDLTAQQQQQQHEAAAIKETEKTQ